MGVGVDVWVCGCVVLTRDKTSTNFSYATLGDFQSQTTNATQYLHVLLSPLTNVFPRILCGVITSLLVVGVLNYPWRCIRVKRLAKLVGSLCSNGLYNSNQGWYVCVFRDCCVLS